MSEIIQPVWYGCCCQADTSSIYRSAQWSAMYIDETQTFDRASRSGLEDWSGYTSGGVESNLSAAKTARPLSDALWELSSAPFQENSERIVWGYDSGGYLATFGVAQHHEGRLETSAGIATAWITLKKTTGTRWYAANYLGTIHDEATVDSEEILQAVVSFHAIDDGRRASDAFPAIIPSAPVVSGWAWWDANKTPGWSLSRENYARMRLIRVDRVEYLTP